MSNKSMKNNDILNILKADFRSTESFKAELDVKRMQWVKEYNGEPYGNEKKGRSTIVSQDIRKQNEWQFPSLIEPFVSAPEIVNCDPITYEDEAGAIQAEHLLNYQFCRGFNRYLFMSQMIKVFQREGTVVVRTGWEFKEEVTKEMVPTPVMPEMNPVMVQEAMRRGYQIPQPEPMIILQEQEIRTTIVNRPTAEVVDNVDVFVDPTCRGDISKAQFVIYRFRSNLSNLKEDGRYKNLDKINSDSSQDSNSLYEEVNTAKNFQFTDDARKEFEVFEYWGNIDRNGDGIAEPIVATWVNNTLIRLEDNPYPDKEIPFVSVAMSAEPFSINGVANAELLSVPQKVKTSILRGVIDNMSKSNNGQKGIKMGALDPINRKKFMNGQDFEFNGTPADFWDGSYNQLPGSVGEFYTMMSNDVEALTGVKSFSGGIGGSSLGNTATAVNGALNSTAKREIDLVRNLAENGIKPLLRKWLSYSSEFLDEEEVVRITAEEYVDIRKDDIKGNIDIDITISTAETDTQKSQELSFMLQTMGQSLPFDMTKMLLSEIADLKKMPALAKNIRDYEQQPDPFAEEMKKLEMEKLKSEIAERQSRANENQVDMELKSAKADNERAKARGTNSKADLDDQVFLNEEDGITRERQINDKRLDHLSKKGLERDKQAVAPTPTASKK
ncbi:hypothetical protein DRO03_09990 [Methanosarcinales archaeon]|nr:MAG: hypothetical protein DRO03_09990 [Methanosarcinales archaeon]